MDFVILDGGKARTHVGQLAGVAIPYSWILR